MTDALQIAVILVLMAIGIASAVIFQRVLSSYAISSSKTELDRPSFLNAAITIVLFFPIALSCCIGTVWLVLTGWEGFERTILFSIGAGLGLGVFMAGFFYIAYVFGRRQERKIDEDMEKIIKTKRPLQARYAAKAAFATASLIFVTVFLNLFILNFSADRVLWQRAFLFWAVFWVVLAVLPFTPISRYRLSFRGDLGARWWLITLMTTAAILVFLSVLIAYVF